MYSNVTKKRKNSYEFIEQLYKIGGKINIKTLRRSKSKIHPRKFLLLLEIPIAEKKDIIEKNEEVKKLKENSLYNICITNIEQTNDNFSLVSFGIIVNNKDYIINFLNKLSKLSKNIKRNIENKREVKNNEQK